VRKILFISPSQFGYFSDHYYLAKYLRNEFQIEFLCFDKSLPRYNEPEIKIHYVNFGKNKIFRNLDYLKQAFQLTHRIKYDVVFCVDFKFSLFVGLFIRASLKVIDIPTGSLKPNKFKRKISNLYKLFVILFFHKVTVISDSLSKLLYLPKGKSYILPLGADVMDDSYKTYDRLHLLYLGTLDARNIEITIEGLALFLKKHTVKISVRYDIIGSGRKECEENIVHSITVNHLEGIVSYHGRKTFSELKPFFENATIGVCFVPQTPFYEVQPSTKIFEYAMSGLITIATDTLENRKLITDETGKLCNDDAHSFCNGLFSIMENMGNYNHTVIRNSLKDFQWEKIANNILLPILSNRTKKAMH
jgi:glycosyltransferase involved in cell wall biosynthesis